MRKGDNSIENQENFELFTPQAMVNVNKEDFEDLWPDDASRDSLHAYRHIEINGEKANYTEQLNVGSGQIEIPLDSGTNNVKLISDYGIQLSDTDKRVCSYLISSVDLQ